jgi:serine/threonine-protein kinase
VTTSARAESQLPAQLGRYHIEGEIARGGMGVVLRAQDSAFHRTVALKVLQEQHLGKTEMARRFLDEAQIMGQLQHPGIPPVHDLGELSDGRPFFAMKLIKGRTLAELLRERPNPAHDLPRFIAIFNQLCQTVAYAHSRGILHRDLKPANVMVGAFAEVQVMDWGLAKLLDGPRQSEPVLPLEEISAIKTVRSGSEDPSTQEGVVLGTPAYMAPEQARGEVDRLDERADVFGLGAILCVILTGQPPYDHTEDEKVQRWPLLELLADAHARLDRCGADNSLVTLAKVCLTPDPPERPRHAGVVAEAVAVYQAQAQERLRLADLERAQAQVKAAEERKRRRLTLALAAALLLLVAGGSGVALWYQHQEMTRAEDEATRETKEAARAQEQELRLAHARAGVQLALKEATTLEERALTLINNPPSWEATLAAALTAVKQAQTLLAREPELAQGPLAKQLQQVKANLEAEERDRQLLAAFDRIRERQSSMGGTRQRLKLRESYPELKDILKRYGLPVGEISIEKAVVHLQHRPQVIQNQVMAVLQECLTYVPQSRVEELKWLEAVLANADADHWRQQVRQAVARKEEALLEKLLEKVEVARHHPAFLVWLARSLRNKTHVNAIRLLRQAQMQYPEDFWVNAVLSLRLLFSARPSHSVRPVDAPDLPLLNEAIRFMSASLAIRPESVWMHYQLGNALRARGDLEGALAAQQKALALNPSFADAHVEIGAILQDKGDLDGSIAAYKKGIDLDPENVGAYSSLGNVLVDKKDLEGAIAACRKAIDLVPNFSSAHLNLGNALHAKKDLDGAIKALNQAIEIDPKDTKAHHNLGVVLYDKGDLKGAIASYKKAIALAPDRPRSHVNLGAALLSSGRFIEARTSLQHALDLITPNKLDSNTARDRTRAQKLLRDCEYWLEMEARLQAILDGNAQPEDAVEQLSLAMLCLRYKKRYVIAVRFYEEALAEVILPGEQLALARSNAAFAAVQAAAGLGEGAAKLDAKEKVRLRQQALSWMREAVKYYVKNVDGSEVKWRTDMQKELHYWQKDRALTSIRDKEALAKLPQAERAAWQQLWNDVETLLQKSNEKR